MTRPDTSDMLARFSGFTFDSDRRLILDANDRAVHVTAKAFDLLALLIAASPRVVSKRELHERLWPGSFVTDAALVGLIKELRRALDDRDESNRLIRTSHGVGYAFTVVVTDAQSPAQSARWITARGRRIQLSQGENVIGRDPRCAVWLNEAGVSRRHARIVLEGSRACIEDLQSKNGTKVRGLAVTEPAALRDGDEIHIGPVAIEYRESDDGLSTETAGVPL